MDSMDVTRPDLSYCKIYKSDKDAYSDLILTLNKAIEKATNVNEAELGAVAKDGMPSIPGMDMFK
jgi:DNA-binding protein YbaB